MPEVDAHHRAERLSHALYGLIIITATLVAERAHVEEVGEALALLLTTALVLVLAHTYSAFMAERAVEGRPLTAVATRLVVADNLPVVSAIVVPSVFSSSLGSAGSNCLSPLASRSASRWQPCSPLVCMRRAWSGCEGCGCSWVGLAPPRSAS